MAVEVRRAAFEEVAALRELYRAEMGAQIRYDSMLPRGIAAPWLLFAEGRVAGYAGVLQRYDPGRLTEFFVLPAARRRAPSLFRELLAASGATEVAAQTNDPLLLGLLLDSGSALRVESVLFHDALCSALPCPAGMLRPARPGEGPPGPPAPQWVIEAGGALAAWGGFLLHYNPPYADIFMEVAAPFRRRGFGAHLVQELKRLCYEAGRRPAARCAPDNLASRRTLERAGLLPCARVVVGLPRPS
jgi:hypothetical protein